MNKTYWKDFWSKQITGLHRSQDEVFLEAESKEKLLHLGSGEKLLDFGCGSADLLVYYLPFYKLCVGADRSNLMLEKAREKLDSFNNQHETVLLNSDNYQIWDEIEKKMGKNFKFNCITTGQVMQYLDKKQITDFIYNSTLHLENKGKICLFDIVDSRTSELWEVGLFNQKSFNFSVFMRLIIGRLKAILNNLKGKPAHANGYSYPPSFFYAIAEKYNLKVTYINSMYYEYRYHIIYY